MSEHHKIHATASYAPAVLPRILLAFSRRRQRIQALQYVDLGDEHEAEIQIDVDCEPAMARELVRMLERIVEIGTVWVQRADAHERANALRVA